MANSESLSDSEILKLEEFVMGECAERWNDFKERMSICKKCPYYDGGDKLIPWDYSYVPESERKIATLEYSWEVCKRWYKENKDFIKIIRYTSIGKQPINLKRAKRLM